MQVSVRKLTLRLRSKDNMERIDTDTACTWGNFKEKVAAQTGVPVADQVYAKDPKFTQLVAPPDNALLGSLGFSAHFHSNGELLHWKYTTERQLKEIPHAEPAQKWTLKSYMENLEAQGLIFTPQGEAHCKECVLDFDAANQFQSYVQSFAFQRQRVGLLYGKYNSETGGVLVEAIYEPPQEGGPDRVIWNRKDPEIDKADAIATLLSLQRVGWVFSHKQRDYLFSAEEVMVAAELQHDALLRNNQEGKTFVTLKLTVSEEGQSQLESFQVSDQAIKLHAKGLFAQPSDAEPNMIHTKEKVLMHTKQGGREDRDKMDTDIVLTRVPLQQGKGSLQVGFPVENHPESPVTQEELKKYLTDRRSRSWVQQISDFHFLLFVANFLDMRTDMPVMCESVVKKDSNLSQHYQMLIKAYAGLQ